MIQYISPDIHADVLLSPEQASQQKWDVIIVGGGMGGGSAAYALTQQGHNVLLVEKGQARFSGEGGGVETEQLKPEEYLNNGRWPNKLKAEVDGSVADIWAPLGCGLGGSSLLYAAALQRLRAEDFAEQVLPDGSTISWPFSYPELESYYQKAEKIFKVLGTADPLEANATYDLGPPPAMCERDQHYFQLFQEAGLHPYRLHVAMEYQKGCGECGGHICKRQCKQDSLNACIMPAIQTGKLRIIEKAEVTYLDADSKRITGIDVEHQGETFRIEAKIVALAAGAYFTPVLLQKSTSELWPQGLANSSGLVGKNLMFHASDFIAFWPKRKCSRTGPNKTIAVRDLYISEGKKLGEFQSTGIAADYGVVIYALRLLFDQSRLKKLSFLRELLRIPAYIASKLYGEATVFTTIVEDYPYQTNQVLLDHTHPSGMRFQYTLHDELRQRVSTMKNSIRQRLSKLYSIPMNLGVSLNYGHPCGTCKAGNDPATSVVDKNCKAHDLENLYFVDSSFMPTSGGSNPSLTIAANALRVADAIDQALQNNK